MKTAVIGVLLFGLPGFAGSPLRTSQVRIANGVLEGVISADDAVRTFKGIPFAAPPVGALRWKEPQPAPPWEGVRRASEYGARCMQGRIYSDMIFRDNGPSEDCLYLNLWMPAHPATTRLPVMIWIYGGGFAAGSTSEPRQDGGTLSKQGVVVVSMNYRLGIFGFFSHPELTKESGHHASGNYGLLDQVAALRWVHDNIAAFGGDPNNVTIFGESAGASSVSALVASPLAKGLFQKAIGESGSVFNLTREVRTLAKSEEGNLHFVQDAFGTSSLAALREKSAADLLDAALKRKDTRFSMIVDGYFLPESPFAIYSAGKQSHVPLLAGWNEDEGSARAIFGEAEATPENLASAIHKLFPERADEVLRLYPAKTNEAAKHTAEELSRDRGVGYAMWKWLALQRNTAHVTTYRYQFDRDRPRPPGSTGPDPGPRAYHSAEIEYVFNVLPKRAEPWPPEDHKIAELMSTYWANFAKKGDPNGPGVPQWPAYNSSGTLEVMHFAADSKAAPDKYQKRYMFLDSLSPYQRP
ncbi:MAG TPA: carboxylesterase family protein [Bryobacteraceae bacterium]|jgi:para-nitrobenzyl esterase